jgi:hypothetical protein
MKKVPVLYPVDEADTTDLAGLGIDIPNRHECCDGCDCHEASVRASRRSVPATLPMTTVVANVGLYGRRQ